MLVGQNAAAEDSMRRCTIFGEGGEAAEVSANNRWIIPTGGGYFFLPSLSALREVVLTSNA
jgi:hypothetical protein